MTPPKCRICGAREHNHRCQGGTPAMRIEERQRLAMEGHSVNTATASAATTAAGNGPPPTLVGAERSERPIPRRWHDDTDSAGEPVELRDTTRKPARFYAPAGQCIYCDRRREAARHHMSHYRERGER